MRPRAGIVVSIDKARAAQAGPEILQSVTTRFLLALLAALSKVSLLIQVLSQSAVTACHSSG